MSAHKNRTGPHSEVWRERIRAGNILKYLMDHVAGKREMTSTQVRAAEVLLRKVLPDLSAIEYSGSIETRNVTEYSDAELIGLLEAAQHRDSRRGTVEAAGVSLIAPAVRGVHDAELEAGENPPLNS